MPKADSFKKAPRSPAKSPKSRKPKQTAATDESTWRASTIWSGSMINKTAAMALYRLKPEDLANLQHEETETVKTIKGKPRAMPMFKYKERDVERQAWKKHGGPEAFKAYLKTLIYSLPPAPKLLDPDDVWIVTPGLIRVKPQFPRWLWRTCNDALDKVGISDWDVENHGLSKQQREKALTSALKTLVPDYPARPDSLLSPSRSVDKLRDVLDRAPKGTDDKDMESWEDGFSGETDYYWSNAYLEQLFQALIDVIEEHGIEGWRNARWEVYDKHAECLGGISYNEREETLHDSAFAWLCGWLEHRSQTLSTRRCEYSEIGRRYNDMLPRLSIGKGVL